jgi:hypothetical protein
MPENAKRRLRGEGAAGGDGANVRNSLTAARDVVADMARWRERRAWAKAVLHLADHHLPASVPCDVAVWLLRRRGIRAAWYHRNPCHGHGCWVLSAEGHRPPPEIHVTTAGTP